MSDIAKPKHKSTSKKVLDEIINDKDVDDSEESKINMYISKCCDAFIIYDGISCICSQCQRVITLVKDKPLTINVKFNDSFDNNISGDVVNHYRSIAKRFSTDPTYELCAKKCPKCQNFARYTRDPRKNFLFICSNPKCRNVFDE